MTIANDGSREVNKCQKKGSNQKREVPLAQKTTSWVVTMATYTLENPKIIILEGQQPPLVLLRIAQHWLLSVLLKEGADKNG